ncbi:MAG: 50S ribosomal protein L9 [Patescibacteria group bacterium UBA2103]
MKVVLTKDIKGLGRKGDVIEQKDGYVLNFLIPQGSAVPENSSMAKVVMQKKGEAEDRKEMQHELLNDTIKGLDGERLVFSKKVNEQGGLYDKIDASEILAKIAELKGVELPEEVVALDAPIETQADTEVVISNGEVEAKVTIVVEAA